MAQGPKPKAHKPEVHFTRRGLMAEASGFIFKAFDAQGTRLKIQGSTLKAQKLKAQGSTLNAQSSTPKAQGPRHTV